MAGKPKVLITGASGLIGGLVIRDLSDKYEFSGLSRRVVPGIPHTQANIEDAEAVRKAATGMDMVLHLAAETQDYDDWDKVMDNTIGGTLNMYRAAQEAGVKRVVFMSTGSTMCGYEWYEGSPYGTLAANDAAGPARATRCSTISIRRGPTASTVSASCSAKTPAGCSRTRYGMSVICIRLGAVLPSDQPELIRHYPGYLSQADAVQMVDKCLGAPTASASTSSMRSRRTSGAGATPATPRR